MNKYIEILPLTTNLMVPKTSWWNYVYTSIHIYFDAD